MILHLLLLLAVAALHPVVAQDHSIAVASRRSVLRVYTEGVESDRPDYTVELNATTFDAALEASPLRFAVVEFFAHWCPACRNYKPQYEKVAKLFNGLDAVHPGLIVMTRVDCAIKINTKLCSRFSVGHYPMLFWGPPAKFASGDWNPKQEKKEIKPIDDGRTADRLLNWINKQLGSGFSLEDKIYENENILPYNASDPEEITRAIYDVEEATQSAFDIIIEHKMIKAETRTPLIQFLQLLVVHHPSKRCRRGISEILVDLDDLWPPESLALSPPDSVISHKMDAVHNFHICGREVPRGYWIFCRGSKKDTRGFSCGLWILLHSLSVRVGDGESHSTFAAICGFIHNFFICEECRQHFFEMCSRVSVPLNTTRDLSLWLWSTHNKVNERLMKEELTLGTGDSKFPKVIWPPSQLCPSCYKSVSRASSGTVQINWNEDVVFNFLVRYYGKMLIASYKDKSLSSKGTSESGVDDAESPTNAVPIGAALAIALVSSVFGALACFWRTQQKNRKCLYQLHTLKNI